MGEKKNGSLLADEQLDEVAGGDFSSWDARVSKNRYMNSKTATEKAENAKKYLLACNLEVSFENRKYPCPVCGSWNVANCDPGIFRYMRVVCYDCGAFRDRDGDDPWGLGE